MDNMLCARCLARDVCDLPDSAKPKPPKCGNFIAREPTNYDMLLGKSAEELAAFLADQPIVSKYDPNNPYHKEWLDWLNRPAGSTEEAEEKL